MGGPSPCVEENMVWGGSLTGGAARGRQVPSWASASVSTEVKMLELGTLPSVHWARHVGSLLSFEQACLLLGSSVTSPCPSIPPHPVPSIPLPPSNLICF